MSLVILDWCECSFGKWVSLVSSPMAISACTWIKLPWCLLVGFQPAPRFKSGGRMVFHVWMEKKKKKSRPSRVGERWFVGWMVIVLPWGRRQATDYSIGQRQSWIWWWQPWKRGSSFILTRCVGTVRNGKTTKRTPWLEPKTLMLFGGW